MKSSVCATLFLLFTTSAYSINDKFRIGISAAPGMSWWKPQGADLQKGSLNFAATYGLAFEYWFAENYGVTTGVYGLFDGGKLKGRDAFNITDTTGTILRTVTEKYSMHSLDIPLYLKLKTNEFNRFVVFGQLGFRNSFCLSARADYNNPVPGRGAYSGTDIVVEKENILKKDNEVTKSIPNFKALIYDVKISAGAGIEYFVNANNSIVAGVFYHNGLLNRLRDNDPKSEKIFLRTFEFLVGFTF